MWNKQRAGQNWMAKIAYSNKYLNYERNLTFSIGSSIGRVDVACQTIPPKIYIYFRNISLLAEPRLYSTWQIDDEFASTIFIFTGWWLSCWSIYNPTLPRAILELDFDASEYARIIYHISNRNKKWCSKTLQTFLWFLRALGKCSKFE